MDDGGDADAGLAEVVGRAGGHAAGAGDDADAGAAPSSPIGKRGLEPLAGGFGAAADHADDGLAGAGDAEGVGTDEAGTLRVGFFRDLHGIPEGHAIGDEDEEFYAGVDGVERGVLDTGGGDEEDGDVDPPLPAEHCGGVGAGVEDGEAEDLGAALAGGYAADDVGAVVEHEACAGLTFAAGDALDEDAGGFVDKNRHGTERSRTRLIETRPKAGGIGRM